MPTTYGLFASAGAVTALLWLERHRRDMGLTERQFWAALWIMLAAAIAGAKALFVVLGWEHYAHGELHLWSDFGTGFVFFGGLVGGLAAAGVFAATQRLSFTRGADYFAVAIPLGHAIGRVGCFFAGCCRGIPPHPVQLYESAGLVLIAWACRNALARVERGELPRGAAFWRYLVLYAALRVVLDPLRADGRPERFLGLSHQQGIALAVCVGALVCQHLAAWWQRRTGNAATAAGTA